MTAGGGVRPRAIALLAVGIAGLALAVAGQPLDIGSLRSALGAVSAVVLLVGAYDRWLWRWNPLGPPTLYGTWSARIRPTPDGQELDSFVVIRQTATTIAISLFTDQSESRSTSASCERVGSEWELSWLYQNESRPQYRVASPIHFGGVRLARFGGRHPATLGGSYWTDRRSGGELELSFCARHAASSFTEAQTLLSEPSSHVRSATA